jgi:hypothetical protein
LLANLGDPKDLVTRAEQVQTPQISQRAENLFKRKYSLLGRAAGQQAVIDFIGRLKKAMDAEKAAGEKQKAGALGESQYKNATGLHLRRQSAHPSSIGPSRSFGGVVDTGGKKNKNARARKAIEERLDTIFSVNEEIAVKAGDKTVLAAERGELVVDGKPVITNHADILKVLVMWLVNNRPEVMQSAIDSIADMARTGTVFR